jgi:hypothetical protein
LAGMTPQGARPETGARQDKLRLLLRRRWPTLAGIATVPALLATGLFDDFVEGVVVAAVLYLAWGVLRRRPGQRRWVAWQVPGVQRVRKAMVPASLRIDRQRHWPVRSAAGQQPFGTTTRLVEAG